MVWSWYSFLPLKYIIKGVLLEQVAKHPKEPIKICHQAEDEQVTFVVQCAIQLVLLDHNYGVHKWNIRVKDIYVDLPVRAQFRFPRIPRKTLTGYEQYARVARILYCVNIFLIKLAILLQLLRVFVPLKQRNAMFWTCHLLIWLNFFYYATYIFLTIFVCKPIRKGWSQRVYPPIEGKCLHLTAAYEAGAAINTVSDFSIIVLPQPVIWHLQISLKKKIGLCLIFFVGLLWVENISMK